MPSRLLALRDVTDEEVEEIRSLLESNDIDYYETPPSGWGISAGAIWIKDGGPVDEARSLLEQYQHERSRRVREQFAKLKRDGRAETTLSRVRREPVRTLVYLAVIALVLYLSTLPFLHFGGE